MAISMRCPSPAVRRAAFPTPTARHSTTTCTASRPNWFPHLSPDGRLVAFLSYPQGTIGHPADKDVLLRFMTPTGGEPRVLASFFGGQGTINVNSWAPDSRRLAYVAYPRG